MERLGMVEGAWTVNGGTGDWQKDDMGRERKIDKVNRGKQQSMGKGRRQKGSEIDEWANRQGPVGSKALGQALT